VSTGVGEPLSELSPTARLHVKKAVDSLVEEFGDRHSRDEVEQIMDDSLRRSYAALRSKTSSLRSRTASRVSA
jgi:hypothetical protein